MKAYDFTVYQDGTAECRLGHEVTPDDKTDHLHREPVDNTHSLGLGRLLKAVESLPPAHDCPGLAACFNHPRWGVIRMDAGDWGVIPPWKVGVVGLYETHGEAIRLAAYRARAEQLAAIQDGSA